MQRLFREIAFGLILLAGAAAQESRPPAVVEGVVVNRISGSPVKRAHVMYLSPHPEAAENAQESFADTDAGGHFSLRLEAGSYRIWVERTGFARQNYGAASSSGNGEVLQLAAGQELRDVSFRLAPLGAIAGRVLDEDGDPVEGAGIQVLKFSYATGRRILIPVSGASSDDRGEYRVYNLPRGRYFLLATQRGTPRKTSEGRTLIADVQEFYAPTYYPSSIEFAGASQLTVGEGAELRDIDFRVPRQRVVTLSGKLLSPVENFASSQLQVVLAPREGAMASSINRVAANVDNGSGRFEFHRVIPGSYILIASQLYRGQPLSGRLPVEVGSTGRPEELTVALTPAFDMTGALRTESTQPGIFKSARVSLTNAEGLALGLQPIASVASDGSFRLSGVTPGFWDVQVSPVAADAWIKSVEVGGRAASAQTIEVTGGGAGPLNISLGASGGRISGMVTADGQAHRGTVVLVPSSLELRALPSAYASTAAGDQGVFVLRGIRPGSYRIFAFEEIEPFAWLDADFLKGVETLGEELTVAEGDDVKRTLTVISADSLQPPR